jgi:hypothetical protein
VHQTTRTLGSRGQSTLTSWKARSIQDHDYEDPYKVRIASQRSESIESTSAKTDDLGTENLFDMDIREESYQRGSFDRSPDLPAQSRNQPPNTSGGLQFGKSKGFASKDMQPAKQFHDEQWRRDHNIKKIFKMWLADSPHIRYQKAPDAFSTTGQPRAPCLRAINEYAQTRYPHIAITRWKVDVKSRILADMKARRRSRKAAKSM